MSNFYDIIDRTFNKIRHWYELYCINNTSDAMKLFLNISTSYLMITPAVLFGFFGNILNYIL